MLTETRDVFASAVELDRRGVAGALATIVSARGSTYRKLGARLLMPALGDPVGNVSGGCLEDEIERLGRKVMKSGEPRLEMYDLTADGDEVWGFGLGCNGAMELFVEPLTTVTPAAAALRDAIERERRCALLTVLSSNVPEVRPGARLIEFEDGRLISGLPAEAADAGARLARRVLAGGCPLRETINVGSGELRCFVEVFQPPPRLIVCGAGHDALPLVRYADELGWRVVVTDVRPHLLTHERFPEAAALLELDPRRVADELPRDGRTFVVIMTHNFLRDTEYLGGLIDSAAAYLGVLGPRRRTEQLLRELSAQGIDVSGAQADRFRSPAGLDIGAEGPEEIAWSIVAEMLAIHRGRAGGPLRERRTSIHSEEAVAIDAVTARN